MMAHSILLVLFFNTLCEYYYVMKKWYFPIEEIIVAIDYKFRKFCLKSSIQIHFPICGTTLRLHEGGQLQGPSALVLRSNSEHDPVPHEPPGDPVQVHRLRHPHPLVV